MTKAISRPTGRLQSIILLGLTVGTVIGTPSSARSASTTSLQLDPATFQVTNGETVTLDLQVADVENLHRVELRLDYDQAGLDMQDADSGQVSVQIQPGPLFCDTCTLYNEAVDGQVFFVAQRNHDGPFSGNGTLASMTVRVTATSPSTYTITFDQSATRLLDAENQVITVGQFVDAALILPPPLTALTGWLTREGAGSDGRSVVNAVLYPTTAPYEPVSWGRTCTDDLGNFDLGISNRSQSVPDEILPSGPPPTTTTCTSHWAFVRLGFTNFLDECYWKCTGDETGDVGWHDLEGGDVNQDGCINILDIVQIVGQYAQTVPAPCYVVCSECPPAAPPPNTALTRDVNGDCKVNILDLTQAAGNFGLCSNCPY